MHNVRSILMAVGLAASLLAGCGDSGSKPPVAEKTVRNAPPPPPPAQTAPQTQTAPQPKPEPERKKAEPGISEKRGGGLYPATTYWRIRDQMVFIQVEKAMQLYKAEHDNKGPKTHEEFMEKIIKASQIHLPDLLQNERYVYDPKREELMIEVQPE